MDVLDDYVRRARRDAALTDELLVRALLGRWVSELEPAIAMRDGKIIGLTLADAPLGSTTPIFNPFAAAAEQPR